MFINYAIILRWVLGWLSNALGSTAITTTGAVATGALTVTGAIAASGNLAIATNKFTVAAASGNTVVAGTLAVASDFSINTNKFTVTASSGNTVVAGTLAVTGATTVTGGIVATGGYSGAHNALPATATSGTDTTPASGTQFVTSIWVPANMTFTGVGFLIGSVGGTDKVYAVLYDSTGAVLANSSLTGGGATVGTAANTQTLAFTGTIATVGPRMFYVGININGNTSRLRTLGAFTAGSLWCGSVAGTHGTVVAITPPTTFTADKGPFCWLY